MFVKIYLCGLFWIVSLMCMNLYYVVRGISLVKINIMMFFKKNKKRKRYKIIRVMFLKSI